MDLQPLGDSGLLVTPIGLGLAALGRPGYINIGHASDLENNYDVQAMEIKTHTVLDAAWEAGIRYFDSARSYGKAEKFLSSWLNKKKISPQSITIGSKWGYTYTAGWQVEAEHHEIKEHSLTVLKHQWQESRSLLQPYLDLYQIHSATLDSGVLDNKDVLAELARLRTEGLRIGLSLSGANQAETLDKALTIHFDGQMLFSSVQATWNILAQEVGPTLAEARNQGMGIIVKEALANGRLTSRNQELEFVPQRTFLEKKARKWQTTIDALAIAVAIQQPWSDVVLSGAATVEHLKSNVAALNLELGSDSEEILNTLGEPPKQYWAKRGNLQWN